MQKRTTIKRFEALEAAEGRRVEGLVHRFEVQKAKAEAELTLVEHIVGLELGSRDPASDEEVAVVRRIDELFERFKLRELERELRRSVSDDELRRRRDAVFAGAIAKAGRGLALSEDEELLASPAPSVTALYNRCTPDELDRIENAPTGTMGQVLRELARKYKMWPAEVAGQAE